MVQEKPRKRLQGSENGTTPFTKEETDVRSDLLKVTGYFVQSHQLSVTLLP